MGNLMTDENYEYKEGYLTSQGFRIHYLEWGNRGEMIVTLHSMMMDAPSFNIFSKSMSKNHRILALDLLGHGESSKPTQMVSLEQQVETVRGVVQKKSFSKFTLIGHSIGGYLGMVYAAMYPEEVSRLVLVDIAPREAPLQRTGMTAPPKFFNTGEEVSAYFKERYAGFTPEALENRLKYAIQIAPDGKIRFKTDMDTIVMVRSSYRADLDLWSYVKKIKAPVLVMKGGESASVSPRVVEKMKTLIKDLSMIEFAGTGHMIPQERPEEFEEAIRNFIK